MFKNLIKSLGKLNYAVTIEEGDYIIKEKETGKDYFSFPCKSKNKETILTKCYCNLLAGK